MHLDSDKPSSTARMVGKAAPQKIGASSALQRLRRLYDVLLPYWRGRRHGSS
jgi:hypothetical protein